MQVQVGKATFDSFMGLLTNDYIGVTKHRNPVNIAEEYPGFTLIASATPCGTGTTTIELWELPESRIIIDKSRISALIDTLNTRRATLATEYRDLSTQLAWLREHRATDRDALVRAERQLSEIVIEGQRTSLELEDLRDYIDGNTEGDWLVCLNQGDEEPLGTQSDESSLHIKQEGVADITGAVHDSNRSVWDSDRHTDTSQDIRRVRTQVQHCWKHRTALQNYHFWISHIIRGNKTTLGVTPPADPSAPHPHLTQPYSESPQRLAARRFLSDLTGERIVDIRRQAERGYRAALAKDDKGLAEIWRIIGSTLSVIGR